MHTSRLIESSILALLLSVAGTLAQEPNIQVTTQAPPNTTIAPTPNPSKCAIISDKPSPVAQAYHVEPCMVAKLAAYVKVGANSYANFENGVVDTTSSVCEGKANDKNVSSSKIAINFDCGQLLFTITKIEPIEEIYISHIVGFYNVNTTKHTISNTTKLFATDGAHYYKCDSEQSVLMDTDLSQNFTSELVLSNFAYEAFRTAAGTDFYKIAQECELDSGAFSDGVRIGVGVCLIAFVVIILIAYFVGRRRWAQRSSYESV